MPDVAQLDRLNTEAVKGLNLAGLNDELTKRSERMEHLFEKGGENYDLSTDEAGEIKSLNDELTTLSKAREEKSSFQQMRDRAQVERDLQASAPRSIVHPSSPPSGGRGHDAIQKSISELFIGSPAYTGYSKALRQGPASELDIDLSAYGFKTVLTETGYAPQAVRTSRLVETALQRPRVADVIPSGTTDQISIVYMEETTATNAAAAVAEGAAKPESALAFTERTVPVRKIATVLPITDELMADVPAMRSYVQARLLLFLAIAEDTALLSGTGVSPQITGLLNVSGIQTQAKGADPVPDTIYKAMVKIQTGAFVDPSAVIANPLDWQDVRLLRTADGIYIWGAPMDAGPERIWGLPVVTTTAMTQNTMLVGAFDSCTQLFRRAGVTFAISTEHSDFFIRNQMMLRVEERLAVVCYRPLGLCTATGV